jgi:hypothetical protein
MMHLLANNAMARAGRSSKLLETVELPDWIRRGVEFAAAEDCFFLAHLYENRGNIALAACYDQTGYECCINHFHIDGDYSHADAFSIALGICMAIGQRWERSLYRLLPLRQIVSCDDTSVTYRCHVVRTGQSWLTADLDSYAELILVTDIAQGGKGDAPD